MKNGIKKYLLFLFILLIIDSASSQATFEFTGYAKNLGIRSSSILTQENFFLNIGRLRSKGGLDIAGLVHAELWLDNEVLAGNFLGTQEFQFRQLIERPTFADLEWTLVDNNDYRIEQRFFRAFTTFYAGQAEVTFGRQRIAWGTGFVWNPTDLLNPFNPAAIELDEKEGVDAGYLALPLGSLSKLEMAYAPGRKTMRSSAALRMGANVGNYDLTVMAGDFQNDFVLGGDFAGYLGGAGLRGEIAYTWAKGARNHFRGVVNADYSFANGLYVFLEFYLNGQGASSKGDYDLLSLLSGRTFNLARYYIASTLTKTVTPLLGLSLYNILNLTDGSALIGPALTHSLASNLELTVSAYLLTGGRDTEFGQLNTSYFGHIQFYF